MEFFAHFCTWKAPIAKEGRQRGRIGRSGGRKERRKEWREGGWEDQRKGGRMGRLEGGSEREREWWHRS